MSCAFFFPSDFFAVNSSPSGMEMDGAGAAEVEVCVFFCFDRNLMGGGCGGGGKESK